MKPEHAWGMSRVSRIVAKRCLGLIAPKFKLDMREKNGDEAALCWMCRQYGGALDRRQDREGGWSNLGVVLGSLVAGARIENRLEGKGY